MKKEAFGGVNAVEELGDVIGACSVLLELLPKLERWTGHIVGDREKFVEWLHMVRGRAEDGRWALRGGRPKERVSRWHSLEMG